MAARVLEKVADRIGTHTQTILFSPNIHLLNRSAVHEECVPSKVGDFLESGKFYFFP